MKPAPDEAAVRPGEPASALNERHKEASNRSEEASDRHEDATLVKEAQSGDPEAFRKLYERYHRRAYAVAFGVVKNQHDALDVVQDAFIKVHRHIGNFHGSSSFYTWLYRIVMNLAIDHVRKAKPQSDYNDAAAVKDNPGDGALAPSIMDQNPGKTVARKELTKHIQQALDELPEYHRAVILLREVEGLSYEEMAKVLRVPKGTIMSRLFHARKKMQETLRGYMDNDFELGD